MRGSRLGLVETDHLSAWARARRHEQGLTQRQLAEKCGVRVGTVKRLEMGFRVHYLNLRLVLRALGHKE